MVFKSETAYGELAAFGFGSMKRAHILLRLLNLYAGGEVHEIVIGRSNNGGDGWDPFDKTWTGVGDIHTNQHGQLLGIPQPRKNWGRPKGTVIDAADHHVDLRGDVPKTLKLPSFLPELGCLDTDAGDLEI